MQIISWIIYLLWMLLPVFLKVCCDDTWWYFRKGAAYLPLDTTYPSHMLQSVLEDALPVVVVASPEFESKLKSAVGWFRSLAIYFLQILRVSLYNHMILWNSYPHFFFYFYSLYHIVHLTPVLDTFVDFKSKNKWQKKRYFFIKRETGLYLSVDKIKVLVLHKGWEETMIKLTSPRFVPPSVHLDNLAFVVYSSGTTGKPKGILSFLYLTWSHSISFLSVTQVVRLIPSKGR